MGRQSFWHKADFHQRLYSSGMKCVENLIQNRPAVDGTSGRIFGVDIGRSPFQRSTPVSGRQQIVNSNVYRRSIDRSQFTQQLLAVWSIRVVRLVISEVGPDGCELSLSLISLNTYVHCLPG